MYFARIITSASLATSEGWSVMKPKFSHRLAPLPQVVSDHQHRKQKQNGHRKQNDGEVLPEYRRAEADDEKHRPRPDEREDQMPDDKIGAVMMVLLGINRRCTVNHHTAEQNQNDRQEQQRDVRAPLYRERRVLLPPRTAGREVRTAICFSSFISRPFPTESGHSECKPRKQAEQRLGQGKDQYNAVFAPSALLEMVVDRRHFEQTLAVRQAEPDHLQKTRKHFQNIHRRNQQTDNRLRIMNAVPMTSEPRNSEPVSPMKTLAGWKL